MNRSLHTPTQRIRPVAAVGARVAVRACLLAGEQRFAGMASGDVKFMGPVEEGSSLP